MVKKTQKSEVLDIVEESKKQAYFMSNEEFFKISKQLEDKHALFYKFWEIGKIVFTESIPTAGVYFDRENNVVGFHINPTFWNYLDEYTKLFIICHEMLHVVLHHGVRIRDSVKINSWAINICTDVVVNHLLVNKFGFNRRKLKGMTKELKEKWEKYKISKNDKHKVDMKDPFGDYRDYCWVDTSFNPKEHKELTSLKGKIPPDDESYEYYYSLLPKMQCSGIDKSMDEHDGLVNVKDIDELMKDLDKQLEMEEKEDLQEMVEEHFQKDEQNNKKNQKAGTEAGNIWTFADVDYKSVRKKRKWETIIKKWMHKYLRYASRDIEQWSRINRRFVMIPKDCFLPTEYEMDDLFDDEQKIEVWFFLDTSGSCAGYKDRFFKAAASLPPNRFNLKLLCFDTKVYETTLASKKLFGFGGTSFSCLETYIQKKCKEEKITYPKAIFVLTDGYGDHISPQYPERWYFFLTTQYEDYLPKESFKYNLDDFE